MRFQLSHNKYIYERSVYTFFSLIGDVGGFNGAIVILPTFLMAIYSERMYQGSIQSEILARKSKKSKRSKTYIERSPLQESL